MKLRTILAYSAIALATVCYSGFRSEAKTMKGLKVYINPGHGGYTSNDRPIRIYPFEPNDTAGYWESKSNLYKGLHMYHILDSLGAKPYLSRTKNTEADDRSLSGISAEANQLGCDLFFSIHSNAGENVNTPLMLYRENTIGTPRYPENVKISQLMWKNFHSNQLPIWTRNTEYVVGDLTFYQNQWEGGLGVLRSLYVVGLLSEGSMHEHRPEAYRLMNDDVWWLEAWHIVKSIMEFYDVEDKFVTGNVAGVIYDNHNLREKDMPVSFTMFGRDNNAPINFAYVELKDKDGKVIQTRTTDNMYNGVYVFRNVTPGEYTVTVTHDGYYTETMPVTVKAMEVTYNDFPMTMKREFPLEITEYSPAVSADEQVSCASTVNFTFNTDIDVESFEKAFSIEPAVEGYFKYSDSYRKASFIPALALEKDTHYTVKVSTDAKTPDTYYASPNMTKDFVFDFTTRNRSRMELIDQFPADGGQVHFESPEVELRFDNTLDYAKIDEKIKIVDSKGKAVSLNSRNCKYNKLSNNYGNAILSLSGNLSVGEEYTLTINGDELRDKEALPLGEQVSFKFTAIDASKGDADATVFDDCETAGIFAYDADNTVGVGTTTPKAERSTSTKFFDKASARFTYKFTDTHDGSIVWSYSGSKHNFNTDDVFGVFVNGDFNNHELWVGFTSGASTTYIKLCDLDFRGWQYKSVKLSELDREFGPYVFSNVKLVQVTSPITQEGAFAFDNMSYITDESNGVENVMTDNKGISIVADHQTITVSGATSATPVSVYGVDGTLLLNTYGNTTFSVPAGIYVVTAGQTTQKVIVK